MKKRFEVDLETIKKDSMYKIQDLQNSLNINSSQLRDVISYKEEKEVYDAKVFLFFFITLCSLLSSI